LSQVIAGESLAEVAAAITRLPRLERAVLEADLAAGEAVSAASLAESLHTTEGSIYAARRRARKRLAQQCRWIREKLKDEPEDHE
jgi:DNA-directed RNA polymerase specialized sigma24 family protein